MPRTFKIPSNLLSGASFFNMKDPRVVARSGLIVLVAANLIAALLAFKPWGGSAEDLAREQDELKHQLLTMQTQLTKAKALVTKAQRARSEGDNFLGEYTTDRRTTFSTLFSELDHIAKQAGITSKPMSYELEQVEGSDTLYQLSITAGYEGNYASLMKFVNLVDRSPRFLIIESLIATPQQSNTGDLLAISIKLDTFVREDAGIISPVPRMTGDSPNSGEKPAGQKPAPSDDGDES